MNVNVREMEAHIEFEPNTYYAAFSAELEASASPMWALVSHLRDASTRHLTLNVIKQCLAAIRDWFGGLHHAGYVGYCTGVSAMIVTSDPELRRHAARSHCWV